MRKKKLCQKKKGTGKRLSQKLLNFLRNKISKNFAKFEIAFFLETNLFFFLMNKKLLACARLTRCVVSAFFSLKKGIGLKKEDIYLQS